MAPTHRYRIVPFFSSPSPIISAPPLELAWTSTPYMRMAICSHSDWCHFDQCAARHPSPAGTNTLVSHLRLCALPNMLKAEAQPNLGE
jgi:hypothetical protein